MTITLDSVAVQTLDEAIEYGEEIGKKFFGVSAGKLGIEVFNIQAETLNWRSLDQPPKAALTHFDVSIEVSLQ